MLWLLSLLSCTPKSPSTFEPGPSVYDAQAEMSMAPEVRMGTLDNGLTYYILPNAKPEDRVELRLAIKVGSLYEEDDQLGVAHFLEHMAFNGTESFPENSLIDYMESIGMSFGAHVNALTSFDRTIYQLHVPTDTEGALEQSLLIMKEQVGNQLLLDEDIDAERGVVLEEWRSGQGSMSRIQDELMTSLLGEQYAKRLPIGTKESIENFTPDAIRRFYTKWYRPDLMAIIAVGDIDPAEIQPMIQDKFGSLPKPPPLEIPTYSVEDHEDLRIVVLSDKEVTTAQVSVIFQENASKGWKYTDYRRLLLQDIFIQSMQVRLMELMMQENPPFLGAAPGVENFSASDVLWSFSANTDLHKSMEGLEAILEEINRWKKHGITESELARAKEEIIANYESSYIDRDNRKSSMLADELVRSFVYNEPVPGLEKEFEITKNLMAEITKEEVDAFSRAVLAQSSQSIQFLLPEQEDIALPEQAEIKNLVAQVSKRRLKAPKEDSIDFELMVRPEGGEIVERGRIEELDVTTFRLGNGVEVWYKPTDYGDRVQLQAFSFGGATQHAESEYITAMHAAPIALLSGIGDYSLMELAKALSSVDAQVIPQITGFTEEFSGESSGRHLEYMFQFLWHYFEEPRFSKLMLNMVKRQNINAIENADKDPNTLFGKTYTEMLWGDLYRARPHTVEEVEAMSIKNIEQIYRARFENPADFRFFFVGNFETAELERLATAYLGTLETSEKRETHKDDGHRFSTGDQKKTIYAGLEDKAQVIMRWHGDWSGQWVARNHLFAMEKVLEIRLRKKLREELGGVYSVSVNSSTNIFPVAVYHLTIQFGCDPKRVDELIAETETIVATMLSDIPTEEEMINIKEQDLQGREESTANNGFWISSLSGALMRSEDPLEILSYEDRVLNRTAEDIQTMANRVFQDKKTGTITLIQLPESAKP